ncbi:MAG: hypothetical protein ACYTFW_10700 [Planctomycetota bacterium]
MVSRNVSEGVEPRNLCIALGQGFLHLEASSVARDNGECVSDVPGSKSIAGHSTVHSGTWESHVVLERSLQQAEEVRRRYGSVAVGPTYIRGVAGVMSGESRNIGILEEVGSMLQRGKVA